MQQSYVRGMAHFTHRTARATSELGSEWYRWRRLQRDFSGAVWDSQASYSLTSGRSCLDYSRHAHGAIALSSQSLRGTLHLLAQR